MSAVVSQRQSATSGDLLRGHADTIDLVAGRLRGERDGFRLHLCVDGGAIRGAVTAGMCHALADAGWLDVFDSFSSVSSGTPSLVWALGGGDLDAAISGYVDTAEKLSVRPGRPVLDLEPLERFWSTRMSFADNAVVALNGRPLRAAVCRDDDNDPGFVEGFDDADALIATAVGGCWIPRISGRRPRAELGAPLDGAFSHPCADSLAGDATHLVVLSPRPDHGLPKAPSRASGPLTAAMVNGDLRRRWEVAQTAAAHRWQRWQLDGTIDGRPTARMSCHHGLSRFTRDPRRIDAAARTSYAATSHSLARIG